MRTSARAFQLGLVCFLIPFAFAFEPELLGRGEVSAVLISGLSMLIGTAGWAVALVGYWLRPLRIVERVLVGTAGAAAICMPTGTVPWAWATSALALSAIWLLASRNAGRSASP